MISYCSSTVAALTPLGRPRKRNVFLHSVLLHHIPLKTNGLTLRVKDLTALLEESWPKFNTPQLIRILSICVSAPLLQLTAKYYTNYVCPKVGRDQVRRAFLSCFGKEDTYIASPFSAQ